MSGLDELHQIERLAAFDLGRLDLLVVEQDIFVLDYLIAANDLVAIDGQPPGATFS
jgi:hypothetical protein